MLNEYIDRELQALDKELGYFRKLETLLLDIFHHPHQIPHQIEDLQLVSCSHMTSARLSHAAQYNQTPQLQVLFQPY